MNAAQNTKFAQRISNFGQQMTHFMLVLTWDGGQMRLGKVREKAKIAFVISDLLH